MTDMGAHIVRNSILVDLLWMHVRGLEESYGVPENERLPDELEAGGKVQ